MRLLQSKFADLIPPGNVLVVNIVIQPIQKILIYDQFQTNASFAFFAARNETVYEDYFDEHVHSELVILQDVHLLFLTWYHSYTSEHATLAIDVDSHRTPTPLIALLLQAEHF